MVFVSDNGYMEGGAVGMGNQYREQSPRLHLGPIWVLISGVRSIFEICLFFCCRGDGEVGRPAGVGGQQGEGLASGPSAQWQSSTSWCMIRIHNPVISVLFSRKVYWRSGMSSSTEIMKAEQDWGKPTTEEDNKGDEGEDVLFLLCFKLMPDSSAVDS
jgi:hypothetical protein